MPVFLLFPAHIMLVRKNIVAALRCDIDAYRYRPGWHVWGADPRASLDGFCHIFSFLVIILHVLEVLNHTCYLRGAGGVWVTVLCQLITISITPWELHCSISKHTYPFKWVRWTWAVQKCIPHVKGMLGKCFHEKSKIRYLYLFWPLLLPLTNWFRWKYNWTKEELHKIKNVIFWIARGQICIYMTRLVLHHSNYLKHC